MKRIHILVLGIALPAFASLSCQPLKGADPLGEHEFLNPARLSETSGLVAAEENAGVKGAIGLDARSDF